jgi:hypothetical protein
MNDFGEQVFLITLLDFFSSNKGRTFSQYI